MSSFHFELSLRFRFLTLILNTLAGLNSAQLGILSLRNGFEWVEIFLISYGCLGL